MDQNIWIKPDGTRMTTEQLDEYVREHVNAVRRASNARHPERVMRQRLRSAAALLYRHGLIDGDTCSQIMDTADTVREAQL